MKVTIKKHANRYRESLSTLIGSSMFGKDTSTTMMPTIFRMFRKKGNEHILGTVDNTATDVPNTADKPPVDPKIDIIFCIV